MYSQEFFFEEMSSQELQLKGKYYVSYVRDYHMFVMIFLKDMFVVLDGACPWNL